MGKDYFLSLLGVDSRQFWALLKTQIQLDFRASRLKTTTSTSARKRSYLITLLLYLLPSFMVASFGLQRLDLFGFAFLTLALSMIFIALAIIIEFNEIIINPDDAEILLFRPLSSRTYFWVKMANLLFYVSTFGLTMSLPPAIFGVWLPNSGWFFVPIYLLISWIAQISVAAFVIILYTLLVKVFNYERLKDILAYVQVIFTFVIFIGYQFLIRLTERIENIQFSANWNVFVPSAWFGGVIGLVFQPSNQHYWLLAGLALAFFALTFSFAFQNLSLDYAQLVHKLSLVTRATEKPTERFDRIRSGFSGIDSLLLTSQAERVGFELVSRYLRRSRSLRTRIFPAFAMPLVIIGLFILDQEFEDPFLSGAGFTTFVALMFLIYIAVFFYQIIPTSDDWEAAWIFYVAPIENFAGIYWGSVKAVLLKYVLPYFVLVFALLATQMPIGHALLVAIYNYIIFISYYLLLTFFLTDLPLSKKYERGQSNARFMLTFVLFPVFAICGGLEYLVFHFPFLIPPSLVVMFVLIWLFAKYSGLQFDQRIRRKECYF